MAEQSKVQMKWKAFCLNTLVSSDTLFAFIHLAMERLHWDGEDDNNGICRCFGFGKKRTNKVKVCRGKDRRAGMCALIFMLIDGEEEERKRREQVGARWRPVHVPDSNGCSRSPILFRCCLNCDRCRCSSRLRRICCRVRGMRQLNMQQASTTRPIASNRVSATRCQTRIGRLSDTCPSNHAFTFHMLLRSSPSAPFFHSRRLRINRFRFKPIRTDDEHKEEEEEDFEMTITIQI